MSHVSVDGKRINYLGTMAVDLEKGLEHKRKVLGLYDKSIYPCQESLTISIFRAYSSSDQDSTTVVDILSKDYVNISKTKT